MNETETFYPTSPTDWRKWLEKNHHSKQSVWLVFYAKSSENPSITWSEAVDIALCFGWIDSKNALTKLQPLQDKKRNQNSFDDSIKNGY